MQQTQDAELAPECVCVVWTVWSVTSVAAFGRNSQCEQTQLHGVWEDVAAFSLYVWPEVMRSVCRYTCICVYSSMQGMGEGMLSTNTGGCMSVCVHVQNVWLLCGGPLLVSTGGIGEVLECGHMCTWGQSKGGSRVCERTCARVMGPVCSVGMVTGVCVCCAVCTRETFVSPCLCVRSEGESSPVNVSMCDWLLVHAGVVVLVNTQL